MDNEDKCRCDELVDAINDGTLRWDFLFDVYGLYIECVAGETSVKYCPYCGKLVE